MTDNDCLRLGAFDKKTKEFIYPQNAFSKRDYICPDCAKSVILKNGYIKRAHFAHKPNSKCSYYNGGETSIHRNGKLIVKKLLESGKIIMFKQCNRCFFVERNEIKTKNNSKIVLEYDFSYKNLKKIADIAHISQNDDDTKENIENIFEIMYSHKTLEGDRPEPWYEIDAVMISILYSIYCEKGIQDYFKIPCIREYYCEKCKNHIDNIENIEKYKSPTIEEQLFYISDIDIHLKYLQDYEVKNGELDMKYEWLDDCISNIENPNNFRENKYLTKHLDSWVFYMVDYIEKKLSTRKTINYNNKQFDCIVEAVVNRINFLCQGPAGTGKSTVIDAIVMYSRLIGRNVYKIAPTGKSARIIEGKTIHKFINEIEGGKIKVNNDDLIIIDEISMVSSNLLTKLLREIGSRNQILYFGDFAQFFPVSKANDKKVSSIYSSEFKVEKYMELTEPVRHKDDNKFSDCLLKFRKGIVDDMSIIHSRTNIPNDLDIRTQNLFYRNDDVDAFNDKCLKDLVEEIYTFYSETEIYDHSIDEKIIKQKEEEYKIKLCLGCQVFVRKNCKAYQDYKEVEICNGMKGTVTDIDKDNETVTIQYWEEKDAQFKDYIIKKIPVYIKSKKYKINSDDEEEDEEDIEEKDILFKIINFPLCLGYASTLHKAQGQTCPVILNLKGYYCEKYLSAIYVALTRPRKYTELQIITENGKYIDFTQIKPTEEQKKLIDGFIYACKTCKNLMDKNEKFCSSNCEGDYKEDVSYQFRIPPIYINGIYVEGEQTYKYREILRTKYGCKYNPDIKKWKIPSSISKINQLKDWLKEITIEKF